MCSFVQSKTCLGKWVPDLSRLLSFFYKPDLSRHVLSCIKKGLRVIGVWDAIRRLFWLLEHFLFWKFVCAVAILSLLSGLVPRAAVGSPTCSKDQLVKSGPHSSRSVCASPHKLSFKLNVSFSFDRAHFRERISVLRIGEEYEVWNLVKSILVNIWS